MLRYTQQQMDAILANRAIFNRQQTGLASQFGLSNVSASALVGNAMPVPKDVWGDWDKESVQLQRSILTVFADLAGSVSQPMNIGKLIQYFRTVSDSGDVNISLDGQSDAPTDQPVYDYHGTPLPIIDSTFSYGWRQMAAAQSEGETLDTDGRDNSIRRVSEKLEGLVLDGDSKIVVGGAQLYGMRNHPKRNTRSTGETLNGATGAQWKAEIVALLKLLHGDNFKRANVTLYVNFDDWFYAGNTDYSTQYPNKTIAQAVREIEGVGQVVAADKVNANEIFGLVKDRSVVRLLSGMPVSTIAKFRGDPMAPYNFQTLGAAALQIKFDAEDNCGLAHSS